MAITTEKATILMRSGLKKDFDPDQMTAGEWAVSIDTVKENQIVWMCFSPGVVKRMGTWDDFENAIQDISGEIAKVYIQAFDEIKAAMEQLKNQTESYKNTASQKAADSAGSADTATQKANAAAGSEAAAKASADASAGSADDARDYATKAESFAHGGTGTRPGEDADNAKKYYEQARDVSQSLTGALKPKGTVTFANLPALSSAEVGGMYNVSNSFTTTADFKEGAGHVIPAGANVYKTTDGKWDILAGTPVASVNGETGNVLVTPAKIGAPTKEEAYLLKGGMGIPKGSDMNGYKTPGNYACGSNAIARTLLNSPTNGAFTLKVDYGAGTSYPRQTYRVYVSGKTFVRIFDPYSGTSGMWTEYKEVPFKDELTATNTKATDTHALLGTANADSTVQALIDAIADRVIDKLLPRDGSKAMTGTLQAPKGINLYKENGNGNVGIDGDGISVYDGHIGIISDTGSTHIDANGMNTSFLTLEESIMLSDTSGSAGDHLYLRNVNGKPKIDGHNSEGWISETKLLDERDIVDSLTSTATDKAASANSVRQLNQDIDGLQHGIALIVTDGMTDNQIDDWIRSQLITGIRRLKIYNDKTNYKFGHSGNFNIWFFGDVLTEMTGIAIDHWSNQVFAIRINHPDGNIFVSRLVDKNELPLSSHIIIESIPTAINVWCDYTDDRIAGKPFVMVSFSYSVGSGIVCPYIATHLNMGTKADNQYLSGEVSVNYKANEGKISFKVDWMGSSQNMANFRLTDIWF